MKINITYQCDTVAEAKEVLEAVHRLSKLPYRLEGFGAAIVSGDLNALVELADPHDTEDRNPNRNGIPEPRPNINPGEPTIGKIGEATKAVILDELGTKNIQPLQPKYTEHLKLLWKRGLIKYDGKEYYL